ncbi:ABC transporter ATP-binding protein [Sulfitobacter mediterraneus]|uniref:ABC transporter ATP-binding protein n=1 Tax=Sulfitobacter mediterraneus TaxID=83219 RepID=UPI001EEE4038|nr:sn-glycerol-3-phosphate ABC transporter ATP-binding protein UgpC [Sulfitobacter mediterraneus]MCD2365540.1 sn-glycerol-3-phosphate ABC transporter ATP-binding protein UgpC [Sulfitobacter mediterraneus]
MKGSAVSTIALKNLSKKFGQVEVFSNLDLTIRSGEFVAFLGPSGCGKSTLLRMIAGLEGVDAGEINIGDRRVDTLPPGARGVAMVFQHYALYPHMTIAENVAFGLRNIGTEEAEIDRRVAEAAEMLEIGALLDRRPAQLSGGQRQRVAIARALVKKPDAFLFDEPLSNLDAALRLRTRIELAQLHKRTRATTIFVTHDQVEAMTLADRIVVMREMKIEQIGAPMEVYNRPASDFVASFVGSPPINMLPVGIREGQGGRAVAVLPDGSQIATAVPMADLGAGPHRLGLRAEACRLDQKGPIHGQIDIVEHLGDHTNLHLRLPDGSALVAETDGQSTAGAGDDIKLSVAPDRLHLFDADGTAHHAPVTS